METIETQYWQFRRSCKSGNDPIYSFVELSGENMGIKDALFILKDRNAEAIQYETREEFLSAKEKTLEEEAKIREVFKSNW